MNEDTLKRFWAKVNKSGTVPVHCPDLGECWEWTASKHRFGYGYFRMPGVGSVYAHRVGWELHNGRLPDGMCVLHKCDNPACVRHDHLFAGSRPENMADKIRKGRSNVAKGEACARAKLTAEKATLARKMYASGTSKVAIADKFGVTQQSIHQVIVRKTWKHVP